MTAIATSDITDSPLYNADLAPTTDAQRTWSVLSIAALWISMSACIPTYTLASGLVASGMNWWEAVLTIFAGSAVVCVPMILNGYAGTKYGIPFPVYCRASFGTAGANVPAMLRALVACGWFGIQSWIGGLAIYKIVILYHPIWADPSWHVYFGITQPQFTCFMGFWLINMIVIFAGIESIRILLDIKAPLLIVLGLVLLGWAGWGVHAKGESLWHTLNQPSAFVPGGKQAGQFWKVFFPSVTGAVGFWATLSLNIPDFTRYAKTQRDQLLGQAIGLPGTMALYSFIAVAVTSATTIILGKTISDPLDLVSTFHNKATVVVALSAIVLATLATNIAANVVSPANDFSNLAPRWIGFRLGGLITGLIGIVIMPWKLLSDPHHYIFIWLIGSSSLLGAVGGVLICDYWVVRRARLRVWDLFKPLGVYRYDRGINWCAVLAVAVALMPCVPGFVNQVTGGGVLRDDTMAGAVFRDLFDYSWFVTFAIAFVLYFFLMIGFPKFEDTVDRIAEATPAGAEVIEKMPTLANTVDGIKLPNPFVIGSGPPGTNANVIGKAFDEGWGAVIIKTISLESEKVTNVAPRYARLRTEKSKEIIGWQNIELISDRPFSVWLDELKMLKDKYPDGVVIASIMEEYRKDAWIEIVERVQETGVAGFELNFSCPHGLPERKMGAAMGQDNSIMKEVCGWVMSAAKIPVWAKLTPNVTSIAAGAEAALSAGCQGVAAINTILCVMSVDLETLRPEPTVEGYTVPGGYSCTAVKPIALRMVKECAEVIRDKFPGRSLSAIGGIESGKDAAQFILLGGDTVQVCTGVMKMGYDCVKPMQDELLAFMDKHKFETINDFKGHSLQYFTTHADLVQRQKDAKAAARAKVLVNKDGQWKGDDFVKQSESLAR